MSRSAFVTVRWSNTKLPLSEPATRRSEGSQWRRSASARISSSGSSRASGGTHAGTHSQSASKWQSSVSVSRRAGPPQLGQVVLTNSSSSASGLPVPVGRMSSGSSTGSCSRGTGTVPQLLAVDDRDRRAPRALARDRRSPRPCSAPPDALAAAAPARRRRSALGAPSVAAVARAARARRRRSPRRCGPRAGMPSTTVAPKRASTSGEISTGSGSPPSGAGSVRPVSISGIVSASRELRSQPPERSCSSCSRDAGSLRPALGLGVPRGDQHEARLARAPRRAA